MSRCSPAICRGQLTVVYLAAFKCFGVHPKLSIIAHTVFHTGEKLAFFMFAFMLVVLGYSFGGWMIFSGQLDTFATPGAAMNTVLDMCLVGNTDYAAMEAAHPTATLRQPCADPQRSRACLQRRACSYTFEAGAVAG